MPDWLHEHAWWMTAASVTIFLLSVFVGGWAIVRMPSDYFCRSTGGDSCAKPRLDSIRRRQPAVRAALIVLKNVLGGVLVLAGVILSLPLVPGPGVVTILVGLSLMDFPGKRRLERWLVSRRVVLAPVNRLRARFGREPLQLPRRPETI